MSDPSQDKSTASGPGADAEGAHRLDSELRTALIAALEWQLEAGADEALEEAPIDRTRAVEAPQKNDSSKRQRAPAEPRGGQKAAAKPAPTPSSAEALAQDARRAAAAAQDLAALKAALEAFEGSSLKQGAKNCVFADGDPKAALMVIGEGPGKDEDRIGKPFVGRSGQLLDRMLAAIGLDRASAEPASGAYIANLVPWRPLGNRTPDDQEVEVLTPFLERHIALARPKAILCVGAPAAKHVMGARSGITRFRGTWTEYDRDGLSIPCLSTLHPAYLLRSPEMKRFAWRDLLALRERLDTILSR